MNIVINKNRVKKFKEKVKTFFDKALKNKKDIDLNSRARDEAEFSKMHKDMKTY